MNKATRTWAAVLGVYCFSLCGGGLPAHAQGSLEDNVPPLPSAVFSGAENEPDKDADPELVAPRLEIIAAPVDEPEKAAAEDKSNGAAERGLDSAGAAELKQDSSPDRQSSDLAETRTPVSRAGQSHEKETRKVTSSKRRDRGSHRRQSVRGMQKVTGRNDSSAEQIENNVKSETIGQSSRRDRGTHSRQSVRGMRNVSDRNDSGAEHGAEQKDNTVKEDVNDQFSDNTASSGAERGNRTIEAAAGTAAEQSAVSDESVDKARPRGTHDGRKVRGYVAPVRTKAASSEPSKQAAAAVKRRQVSPGQYGEALGSIVAEEMRVSR